MDFVSFTQICMLKINQKSIYIYEATNSMNHVFCSSDQSNVILCEVNWSCIRYTAVRLGGWHPVMMKCILLHQANDTSAGAVSVL